VADIRRIAPSSGPGDPTAIVEGLRSARASMNPFDPRVLEFAEDLARRLRRHPRARTAPALLALSHWIRPAGIAALREHWDRICSVPGVIRTPRGVVFHLPPTNVDTLFVYSWLLSALAGNANVIRLSPTAIETGSSLVETVVETLDEHPGVAATTAIVSYGHDTSVTERLSASDVRVIWGGDEAVRTIRSVPLAVHATELVFPDRFSFVVVGAEQFASVPDVDVDVAVHGFVNDAYWFDQLGCSSPRMIVWVGSPEHSAEAAERFRAALVRHLDDEERAVPTSAVIAKLVFAAVRSADGATERVDWTSNEATFVTLDSLRSLDRHGPGGGLFQQVTVSDLGEVTEHIARRDQTVTHWGIRRTELESFAASLGARGVERLVPVGRALEFSNHWDGHDLLHAFSRGLVVDLSGRSSSMLS